jgi:hypothetical protein
MEHSPRKTTIWATKTVLKISLKGYKSSGTVAHDYNPSYLAGEDLEDPSSRLDLLNKKQVSW